MYAARSPDWIRDAAARTVDEIRAFVATGAAFLFAPGAFARDWAEGRSPAPNPFAILATGAGTLAAARLLIQAIAGRSGDDASLLTSIRDAVAPFVHYAFLGAVCHAALRPFSRARRSWRDSLAISLFAAGGPGVASVLSVYLVGTAAWLASGRPEILAGGFFASLPRGASVALQLVAMAAYLAFLGVFLLALRALHGVRLWQAALGLLLAVACAALLFGVWNADVPFGTRLILRLRPLHVRFWVD